MKTPTIAPPGAAVTDTGPAPSAAEPGAFAELLSLTTARTAVAEGSQKDRPDSGAVTVDQDAGGAAPGDQQAAPDLGEVCVAAAEAIVVQLDEPAAALTAAPAGAVQTDAVAASAGVEVSNAAPQADVAAIALSAPAGKHESVAIAQALAVPVAVSTPTASATTAAPSVEAPANREAAGLTVTPALGTPLEAGPVAGAPALAAAEPGQGTVAAAADMKAVPAVPAAPAAPAAPATAPVQTPAQAGPEAAVASAEAVAATDPSVAGTVPESPRKDSVHAAVAGADRDGAVLKSSEAQAQPSSDQQPEPGQRQPLDRILGAVQRAVPAAIVDAAAQSSRPETAIAGDQPVAAAPTPTVAATVAPQAPGQQPAAQQPAPHGAPVASHAQAAQPSAVAAPVAHQPVLTHAATTATVERIHELVRISSLRDGTARATLQLKPAELGTVNVHLRTTADGLVATIRAQDATALSALRHAGAELQQSLQDRGINLARIELGLSSGGGSAADDSRQAAQAFADGRGSGGDRGHRENAGPAASTEHQIELEPVVTTHVLPDGVLVDVRA